MEKNKSIIVKFSIGIVVVLLVLLLYSFYNSSVDNYNILKKNKSEQLVYTKSLKKSGSFYQYIPSLNIDDDISQLINADIDNFLSSYSNNNVGISYEYNVHGKILSLVIVVEDYGYVEGASILYFKTYNIDLKRLVVVSDNKLLDYFNMSFSDVNQKLDEKLYGYYEDILKEDLIDYSCDYQCFLESRDFSSSIDDVQYYVRDGKLFAYKPYTYIFLDSDDYKIYDFQISD